MDVTLNNPSISFHPSRKLTCTVNGRLIFPVILINTLTLPAPKKSPNCIYLFFPLMPLKFISLVIMLSCRAARAHHRLWISAQSRWHNLRMFICCASVNVYIVCCQRWEAFVFKAPRMNLNDKCMSLINLSHLNFSQMLLFTTHISRLRSDGVWYDALIKEYTLPSLV